MTLEELPPKETEGPLASSALPHPEEPGVAGRRDMPAQGDADETTLEALAEEARAKRDEADLDNAAGGSPITGRAEQQPSSRRSVAPADGERNAVVGYLGQYEFAALRTIAALREGALVAVRVADVHAGQIDDFQLLSDERVDAHQVKWSLNPGSVGFAEFVNDGQSRICYIRQLADGWERLNALHHPRRVIVHFVTNDIASDSANPSIPRTAATTTTTGRGRTRSFAAFSQEALRPAMEAARRGEEPSNATPVPWREAMAAIRAASGLDDEAWPRFLADCEFEFGVPSLEASISAAPVSVAERAVLREDAGRLAHTYMRLVARADRRIEFDRQQLLDEVGWRFRAEFKHSHEFPDPEIPYRSIAQTVRELNEAIRQHTSGYIAVVGSPGSGKSTLLTRSLRETPFRVIRYYAYVRDSLGAGLRRGEAVNFLHDLTIALDRAGFHTGAALPVDDLDLLSQRVHAQLRLASRAWSSGGPKTMILVDGLDHIPREQHPTHSLLAHLPPPESVPDGVLFLLGTQTDRLQQISARIRAQLDEPERRMRIRALERNDVLEIIEASSDLAPRPSAPERERIVELSGGHPLALNYIINRLRHSSGSSVRETLDAVEPFNESIDRQYSAIWGAVEDDVDLARLLALVARARGPARVNWLRRWASAQALHAMTTRLAYLFKHDRRDRWTFFHNSFRAFLIDRTNELPVFGGGQALFAELARNAALTGDREPERADELFYRANAGEMAAVLALANPADFRRQFLAGRSSTTILDDLGLALDAATAEQDIVALTRVVLCTAEFTQRDYYVDRLPLPETWLELGELDFALDALRDGATLRTSRETALNSAGALNALGFHDDAREVFALAEPLDTLHGIGEDPSQPQEDVDLLDTWISVVPAFRPVTEIVSMIDTARDTAEREPWPLDHDPVSADAIATSRRQLRLLQGLGIALDDFERWEDADSVRGTLRTRAKNPSWWYWAQSHAWRAALDADQADRAEARFGALREAIRDGFIDEARLARDARVALADGYVRVSRDLPAARRALEGLTQPEPVGPDSYDPHDGWKPFRYRFALNRTLAAVGDERPIGEILPDPSRSMDDEDANQSQAFVTTLERAVIQLGRLAGRAWIGDFLAASDFDAQARRLVSVFPDNPHLFRGGYVATHARDAFFKRAIETTAAHGDECLRVLRDLLDKQWADDSRRGAWPDSLVRSMLTKLLALGAPQAWVSNWLKRLGPLAFSGDGRESELSDGISQARAWVSSGDVAAGRRTLERVLGATFGNEEKDDQLSSCIEWAQAANREDPARAAERLAQMAAAVVSLDGTAAQRYVAPSLLDAGLAVGARPARALVEWAFRNDVRGWVEGVSALLRGFAARTPTTAGLLSACYRSLVLPFAKSADVDTVTIIGGALRSIGDAEELNTLAQAIEIAALPSTRPALRAALAGTTDDIAYGSPDESATDPAAPGHVVEAFEGLSLTVKQLQSRVQSPLDVVDLAGRLKPNAYSYRWERILGPLLARSTADELVAIAAAVPQNDYAWRVLSEIAERLHNLGDVRALPVASRVLRASRAAGWSERYDGGSRISAYELHTRLFQNGRIDAWNALRRDCAAGEVRALDLFREWARVVPMLAPTTPAVQIWDVVSDYVDALVQNAHRGEALSVPEAHEADDPGAAADAIHGLVMSYIDHPAIALAQGARRFFFDRLLAGDSAAEAAVGARLREPECSKAGALLTLRAFSKVRGTLPESLREPVRALRQAPSYADRRTATQLVEPDRTVPIDGSSSLVAPALGSVHPPLPALFTIIHPAAPPRRREPLLPRGGMLEPAREPADLVSLYRAELDLIAKWAEIQPEALYRYVADRAVASLPVGNRDYAFDDEPDVREGIRRLDLEVTYRRPRTRRVERAMGEATAMLVDHGRLTQRHMPALDRIFRNADPFFVVVRPGRRPSTIAPIPERANSDYLRDGWTSHVTTDHAVTGRVMRKERDPLIAEPEGATKSHVFNAPHDDSLLQSQNKSADSAWIVLAEETWLRWLDWKLPTETRIGVRLEPRVWASMLPEESYEVPADDGVVDGVAAAGQTLDMYVADSSHLTADEYLSRAGAGYSLIVRNVTYRFETGSDAWLAFNPALAEYLGWRPSTEGLFRWLDSTGSVVAESMWWEDGFSQQRPPGRDDEVGGGWLVRVSQDGWRQISAAVGECVDWRRVARHAEKQRTAQLVDWDPVHD
jgi:hypothetical protein